MCVQELVKKEFFMSGPVCRGDCITRTTTSVVQTCGLQRIAGNSAFHSITTLAFNGCIHQDPQVRADYLNQIRDLSATLVDLTNQEKYDLERYINLVCTTVANCCDNVTINTLL